MDTMTWERVALATGPGAGAEEAVRQAYREAGLAEPERVLVLASPLAGAVVAAYLTGDDAIRARLRRPRLEQASGQAPGKASGQVSGEALGEASGQVSREALGETSGQVPGEAPGQASGQGDRVVRTRLDWAGPAARDVLDGGDPGRSVRDAIRTVPWERARAATYAELGAAGWAQLWGETGGRLWPQVERLVTDIRRAIADWGAGRVAGSARDGAGSRWDQAGTGQGAAGRDRGADQEGESLRRVTIDAVLGQHDAPWLSAFDGLDGVGGSARGGGLSGVGGLDGVGRSAGVGGPDGGGGLGGLKRVAEQAGWWWPYERLAIITERPVELHLDDLGRLHRADGPALSYADGFALHAWHGMPVPPDFGATMTGLTPERIREEANAELRRAMLEHFGMERYLAESGAKPMQSDETGVLWRIELPGDEPLAMVEVVNSTPEPDGTSRTYFLRVPPWVQRAREGVAWTFGLAEQDYRPQRET
ncbi:hypothetical protein GCM10009850_013780 [Nonomuraea monospora]|uniref:DUF6745 domain-containing protein n=1 Tax=Nonomuraea monospora TaxID=568818 RepID=A0ABP5P259_9ACTN